MRNNNALAVVRPVVLTAALATLRLLRDPAAPPSR